MCFTLTELSRQIRVPLNADGVSALRPTHTHTLRYNRTHISVCVCVCVICSLFRERPTAESLEMPRLAFSLFLWMEGRTERREVAFRYTGSLQSVHCSLHTEQQRSGGVHSTKYSQRYQTHTELRGLDLMTA